MVGTIVSRELLHGRGRWAAGVRLGYAGCLLLETIVFAHLCTFDADPYSPAPRANPAVGALPGWFVVVLAAQQALAALAAAVFAAGSLGQEKAKGTLQDLLTTDLSSLEIVLGKLLGQTARALALSQAGWVVLALAAGIAGVKPGTLLALVAVLIISFAAAAALGVLAAVRCRSTASATFVAVVCFFAGWAVLGWAASRLTGTGPLGLLEGFLADPESDQRGPGFAVLGIGWAVLACAALLVAAWRLRPESARQVETRPGVVGSRWLAARPPVSDFPIEWKEAHVEGDGPWPALPRLPLVAWTTLVVFLTAAGDVALLVGGGALYPGTTLFGGPVVMVGFAVQGLVVLLLGGLVVGVRGAVAVSGERERGTWDAVRLTPLTPHEIVRDKFGGILAPAHHLLGAYALTAVVLSVPGGPGSILWTTITVTAAYSLMSFLAAAGLAVSARSVTFWESIHRFLGRVAAGLGMGLLFAMFPLFLMFSPCGLMCLWCLSVSPEWGLSIASWVGLAVFCLPLARFVQPALEEARAELARADAPPVLVQPPADPPPG
jgi:hypothetical protein